MSVLSKLKNINYWMILMAIGVVIELGMQTCWQGKYGMYWSPVIWMLGGLLFCFAAWKVLGIRRNENEITLAQGFRPLPSLLVFLIYTICALYIGDHLNTIYTNIPVDPKTSDIIPSLQMYVQRFLQGEIVYRPLQFDGYFVNPTYFPMLWLPYSFSELLAIDYRWTAYGVFLLAIFIFNINLIKQEVSLLELAAKALMPFILVYAYIRFSAGTLGMAVELMPVGLYLLLCLSLFNRSRFIMALGILIVLLSRYAFTFWLPIYLLIYWIEFGFGRVFQVSFYVLVGVVLLYILPFLSKDWTVFQKGLAYYKKTATTQWVPQAWQGPNDKPHHLTKGMSYAIYFYDLDDRPVEDRLALNRKVHIVACAFAALFLLLGYFYFRKKGLDTKMYLIIGLKFYLIIFYGFFYVPFSYLFKLPFFLCLPILYKVPFERIYKRVT